MASRSIEDLTPETQELYHKFAVIMKAKNIPYIVTCTYRSQQEQDALYEQGRTKPGQIVTWTRKSRHTDREAFDIAILKNGKISWRPEDYVEAVKIGKAVGLDAGGAWTKNKDYPHFEKAKEAK
jgi:peptidoglycan L-alanyl-D-glutamate endopeptidase CwlK